MMTKTSTQVSKPHISKPQWENYATLNSSIQEIAMYKPMSKKMILQSIPGVGQLQPLPVNTP